VVEKDYPEMGIALGDNDGSFRCHLFQNEHCRCSGLIARSGYPVFACGDFFSCSAHLLFSPARYRQIVSMMGRRMTFSEAVMIRMGCNPVKGILPFKVGELAIVAYMKKKYHLSYPGGVLSVFAGYPFSLLVLIIFYATGGLFYFPQGGQKIFFALLLMVALILASPFGIREMIFLLFDGIRKFKRISGVKENFFTEMHIDQEARKIIFYSLGVEGSKLLIIFAS